jgi:hypothetical protein
MRRLPAPIGLASGLLLALAPAPAQGRELESVAVQYLRPPCVGFGGVEIAISGVGAGFHFDAAWKLTGVGELSATLDRHVVSGVLSITRVATMAPSMGALIGSKTLRDIFWAMGPSYIALGAIDAVGAVVAIDSAVRLDGVDGSTSEIDAQIIRSRTVNQGWGVSIAILSGVEFVLGIASTVQGIQSPNPVRVWVVPTPGGAAIAGRFGAPQRRH